MKKGTKLRAWTTADIDYLIANYRKPRRELATKLGRTEFAVLNVEARLRKAGKIGGKRGSWRDAETQYLIDHPYQNIAISAKALGRSVKAIYYHRCMLRKAGRMPIFWTDERKQLVVSLREGGHNWAHIVSQIYSDVDVETTSLHKLKLRVKGIYLRMKHEG